jgi:hypothetical protein
MNRLLTPLALLATVMVVGAGAAKPKFTSVWKTPAAGEVTLAGKKVAALVISNDTDLRVSGEEALVRELGQRGLQGVATYRIAPKEELTDVAKAKGWFERAGVEGVVALRPISSERRTTYTPSTWANPYYGTLWGYYGYGWNNVYIPGSIGHETVVTVETLIFSVPKDTLLWAAVSESEEPKTLAAFMKELVEACVDEMHRQGLARAVK